MPHHPTTAHSSIWCLWWHLCCYCSWLILRPSFHHRPWLCNTGHCPTTPDTIKLGYNEGNEGSLNESVLVPKNPGPWVPLACLSQPDPRHATHVSVAPYVHPHPQIHFLDRAFKASGKSHQNVSPSHAKASASMPPFTAEIPAHLCPRFSHQPHPRLPPPCPLWQHWKHPSTSSRLQVHDLVHCLLSVHQCRSHPICAIQSQYSIHVLSLGSVKTNLLHHFSCS